MADIPRSDLEESLARNEEKQLQAKAAISSIGSILDGLSARVDSVEDDAARLGPTICRFANELADSVSGLNERLRQNSKDDRVTMARALKEDASRSLLLVHPETTDQPTTTAAHAISNLSEDDLAKAFSGVETLLSDVEASLRSIGKDEAEELAEVGLMVARIFLFTLQSFYQRLAPQITSLIENNDDDVVPTSNKSSVQIEELPDESSFSGKEISVKEADKDMSNSQKQEPRTAGRLLWPPIGPAVLEAGKVGTQAAHEHPILAVALAMTLWPAATVVAFLGIPFLTLDWALQSSYDALPPSFSRKVVQTASNVYQVGHLYYLCAKLLVKQGAKVGQRQIERRGGLGQVTVDIGGTVVDRAMHPVETVGMAVNGIKTGIGMVMNVGGFMKNVAMGNDFFTET